MGVCLGTVAARSPSEARSAAVQHAAAGMGLLTRGARHLSLDIGQGERHGGHQEELVSHVGQREHERAEHEQVTGLEKCPAPAAAAHS